MDALIIFVKKPEPGAVKTRLTPFLSHEEAAELYLAFIRDTLATSQRLTNVDTHIAFTPDDAQNTLQSILSLSTASWFPQTGETLGARLWHAFQHAFQCGASRVVTIGSDSPTLTPAILAQGFEALAHSDVVVGPAKDGGYYLIGLAHQGKDIGRFEALFRDIEWSTERVYPQTIEAVQQNQLKSTVLPIWSDVDQPEDLVYLMEQIQAFRNQGETDLALYTGQKLEALKDRLKMVVK